MRHLYALWALLPLLCAGFGFLYGARLFFRKGQALFAQLVVCALGCLWLRRLFSAVWLLVRGVFPAGFHVGYFGIFGSLMFLFSANFDQMDHLVDSGDKAFQVWRRAALAPPLLLAAVMVCIALAPCAAQERWASLLALLPAIPASYYACKHLLLPDEAMWLLEAIRPYQLCALSLCAAQTLELAAACRGLACLEATATAAQSALCLLVPEVLNRGIRKWMG